MFGPEEFKARLLGIRINPKFPLSICDEEELIGCSEEEIQEIEQSVGFPLPKAYKDFMLIAGKKSGEFLSDCQIHYPNVTLTNQRAKKTIGKYFTFPEPCFVFSSYLGDVIFFPPIYQPVSIRNGKSYKKCAPSFWKCIEDLLNSYSSG